MRGEMEEAVSWRVAMTAVAEAWRELQAREEMASLAWDKAVAAEEGLGEVRAQQEACEDAAARARERVARVSGESDAAIDAARGRGRVEAKRAMKAAAARLQSVVQKMWRADDDLAIAGDALDDAEDLADVLDSEALDADDMAEMARERLCAAEWRAAWFRAVGVVARQRRGCRCAVVTVPMEVASARELQGSNGGEEVLVVGLVQPVEEQEALVLVAEEQENSAGVEPTVVLKGGVPRVVRARWELLAGTSVLWARRSHRCGGGGKIDGGGDDGSAWRQFDPGG